MATYNRSDNARRRYTVTREGCDGPGRRWIFIACPFCGTQSQAFVWSLCGGGKRCENKKCKARHDGFGNTIPRVGREDMTP